MTSLEYCYIVDFLVFASYFAMSFAKSRGAGPESLREGGISKAVLIWAP